MNGSWLPPRPVSYNVRLHRSGQNSRPWAPPSPLRVLCCQAGTGFTQQQTGAQQSCINSYNKAALRLARARAKSFNPCVLEATSGQRHIETCYTYDPDGKVEAAQAKLARVDSTRCAAAPDFGHGALAAASGTASAETIDLLRQLHLVLPAQDASRSACLRAVDDLAQKLLQAKLNAFGKCTKDGLARGTVISPGTLADCLSAAKAVADARLAKLVTVIERAMAKSCPYSSYLQGCGDQSSGAIAACMDRIADCRACEFVAGVDGTTPDCDTFDDGALNDSCPDACGNGVVGAGLPSWQPEACDDANGTSGDGCDYNCTASACGNGIVAEGELCDQLNGRCVGGALDGAPCDRNAQCGSGYCTSCPEGGCSNDCTACGAGACCSIMFGCVPEFHTDQECSELGGTAVTCDDPVCQHSGTCCKHLYLDWAGCHSDPEVLANCYAWGGMLAPCSECERCCAFDGYCTSWDAGTCLEYEGTPVDCSQCWAP